MLKNSVVGKYTRYNAAPHCFEVGQPHFKDVIRSRKNESFPCVKALDHRGKEEDWEVKLLGFLALELYGEMLSASGSGHFMTGKEGLRQGE
jgi:hypothetical protein